MHSLRTILALFVPILIATPTFAQQPPGRIAARKACCAQIGGRWEPRTDNPADGTCYPSGPQAPFYQCLREKGFQ